MRFLIYSGLFELLMIFIFYGKIIIDLYDRKPLAFMSLDSKFFIDEESNIIKDDKLEMQLPLVSPYTSKEDVNEITEKDNKTQGILMLVVGSLFLLSVIWQMVYWGPLMLPSASSEHGVLIDNLMSFTMWLIIIVFFTDSGILKILLS